MNIFPETVEFREKYFLMEKNILITIVKSLSKKGGRLPAPETPSYLLSFLLFSGNITLLSAVRFGFPLYFLECCLKKWFGMNL